MKTPNVRQYCTRWFGIFDLNNFTHSWTIIKQQIKYKKNATDINSINWKHKWVNKVMLIKPQNVHRSPSIMSRTIQKPNNRFAVKTNRLVSTQHMSSSKVISKPTIWIKPNSWIINPKIDRQSCDNCVEIVKTILCC